MANTLYTSNESHALGNPAVEILIPHSPRPNKRLVFGRPVNANTCNTANRGAWVDYPCCAMPWMIRQPPDCTLAHKLAPPLKLRSTRTGVAERGALVL